MTVETDIQGHVALVTGAARRIGAAIARTLHEAGMNVALHFHRSSDEAHALHRELNEKRPRSATLLQADLHDIDRFPKLINGVLESWGRLDALINNAATFFPTPIGSISREQWDALIDSNLRAPFFLAQSAMPALAERNGCIINIADVHADRPLRNYSVYSISKAGLVMMTKSLARELGPAVRVNALAPGAILWPEDEMDSTTKQQIVDRIALKRQGEPAEVARAVLFLIRDASYTTGQIIAVDGGRSLYS